MLLCQCNAFTKHIELLLNLCSSFPCVFHVASNTCFNLTWCECKGMTLIIVAFPSNKFQKPVRRLIPVGCLENELYTHSCSSRCVVCRHFHVCDRFKARSLVRILRGLELVTVPIQGYETPTLTKLNIRLMAP